MRMLVEEHCWVINKEGVKTVLDVMSLCVMKCSFKWNPDTLQVHCADLYYHSSLLVLQNAIALAAGHSYNIKQLCTVHHVVIGSPSNTDALDIHLVAKRVFVFPDSVCESSAEWWEVVLHGC